MGMHVIIHFVDMSLECVIQSFTNVDPQMRDLGVHALDILSVSCQKGPVCHE